MDYNLIWYILLAVLFIGYIILDGFDLGVGMLIKSGKSDKERRIIINSIGPVWDGNEVWLITAGGALFAAFPHIYATIFSGYYTAFMLFLLVLIMRGVSIEFRSKVESTTWRNLWDNLFMLASYLITLLLGVAFANVFAGIPIDAQMEYHGGLLPLLNPYAIVFAIMGIAALRLSGNLYLLYRTENDLYNLLRKKTMANYYIFFILYVITLVYTVITQKHLLINYSNTPLFYLVPILAIIFLLIIPILFKKEANLKAFIAQCAVIALTLTAIILGMFPNFVISNPEFANSLTAYNSSSSDGTLSTMFIIALIGVPLVLTYQIIIYRIFRGKVKLEESSY